MDVPVVIAMTGAFVLLAGLLLVVRQLLVARQRGVFECSLWRRGVSGRSSWQHGLMRFGPDDLGWYRALSWRVRPQVRIRRRDITGDSRAPLEDRADGGEDLLLVRLAVRGRAPVQAIMARSSASALSAWLEAAPMGFVLGDAD